MGRKHTHIVDLVGNHLNSFICILFLTYEFKKKNQTTPRPSEHPPVMGGEMSKRLGGIKRLQIQNLFMAFKQTGSPMQIALGPQHNVGEKPTVILYIYINRHAGTPEKH